MTLAFALLVAAGLNVSPVQVRLTPEESKALITLRNDGARKVVQGMTTPEEVMLMTAESTV